MNFFRLRFLNTFLLFLTGIILGFILKERFQPSAAPAAAPAPQAAYGEGAGDAAGEEEETGYEAYQEEEEEPRPPVRRGPEVLERAPAAAPASEIVIEPGATKPQAAPAQQDEAADFFSHPQQYAGREVRLRLQMITAKKNADGWRLNLVYYGPSKKIDYLYVEDSGVLGEKPDLRIGFVYKLRFACGKGETASGNTLVSIEATGEKADWATGLSAVE
jgi:hypothetical protein